MTNTYHCPCCDRDVRFRKGFFFWNWTIFDVTRYRKGPQNVICPVCGSLPRHRIIAAWCGEHWNMLKGKRILLFAPERCMVRYLRRNGIPFVTADLYHRADLKLDIQDTGLEKESYDLIFCNHVLEHVDDLRAAIRELYRITSLQGVLICSFPIDLSLAETREKDRPLTRREHIRMFGQYDHNRLFGRDSQAILAEAGYDVETIDTDLLPSRIMPVTGPADYDSNLIFVCTRHSKGGEA